MLTRFVLHLIIMISLGCMTGIVSAALAGGFMRDTTLTYLALVHPATSNYDIFVMDSRTRVTHNLTHHPAADFDFSWSPDGTRLAFLSNRAGASDMYIMAANGREVQSLNTGMNPQGLAWSPDGSRIGFLAARESSLYDIYTVSLADGTLQNLTDTMVVDDSAFAWSPDGSQMLVIQENHAIHVLSAAGSAKHYAGEVSQRSLPVWSPDGSHIAHFQWDGVLYVTAADGKKSAVLTGAEGRPSPLAWSPDGATLARVIEIDEQNFIRLLHLASGTTTDFPTPLHRIREMVWSPDSTTLLIAAGEGATGQEIYRLTRPDGQLTRLTYTPYFYQGVGWKPG